MDDPKDEGLAIARLVTELIAVWNARDTTRFAACFTSEADYVTSAGVWIHGQDAIARLLDSAEGLRVALVDGPAVRVHGDAASVVFRWRGERAGGPTETGIVTCVLIRQSERWRIDRLQNTAVESQQS